MTWTLFYGGQFLLGNLTEANVTETSQTITAALAHGGGWIDISFPTGEGVLYAKVYVSAGVPICFYPDIDNRDLVLPREG